MHDLKLQQREIERPSVTVSVKKKQKNIDTYIINIIHRYKAHEAKVYCMYNMCCVKSTFDVR